MNEKETLKNLIDNAKQPNVTEWVFNVETFLRDTKEGVKETSEYIASIKRFGDEFQHCANLIAWLRQLYKRKYDGIEIPAITKRNQIFMAMMFVYYEAGIARGLQLCKHPIKLILTCKQEFFDKEKVHFDVSGDNILLYTDVNDLSKKLEKRLKTVLGKTNE